MAKKKERKKVTFSNPEIEGKFLNLIKNILQKILQLFNDEKLDVFPLRLGTGKMSTLTTPNLHHIGTPSTIRLTRK